MGFCRKDLLQDLHSQKTVDADPIALRLSQAQIASDNVKAFGNRQECMCLPYIFLQIR